MQYTVSYWCASHIGKLRSVNQDNFICDGQFMELNHESTERPLTGTRLSRDFSLFGIYDGMGGEECGEIASHIAAKNAALLTSSKDAVATLSQFCQAANAEICSYAKESGISAMGTTAAMLAFTSKKITLCNIGDSKIFRFCGGTLEQISKDHVAISAFGKKPPLSLTIRDKGGNNLCGTTLVPFMQTALGFALSGEPGTAYCGVIAFRCAAQR